MKKVFFFGATLLFLASCGGGASEEQTTAAKDFCDCMSEGAMGDFDIDYYECELKLKETHGSEITSDEGWTSALEDECPDVSSKLTESE